MEEGEGNVKSELGLHLKSYWENFYQEELENFEDHGDTGEIWFGNKILNQIVQYICQNFDKSINVLDIGCGNGHFLLSLYKNQFRNLSGIDYSSIAIELAKSIAAHKSVHINYQVANLINVEDETIFDKKYDLCHDKGTYDAITLSPDKINVKTTYKSSLKKLLSKEGTFIITSCNWTKDELVNDFNDEFNLVDSISTPQFQFGGKVGNTVTTLVFKHK